MDRIKNEQIPVYNREGDINDTQKGAIFGNINGYTLYQFNTKGAYNYYLAIPDNHSNTYQLFIGFPQKDLKSTPKKDIVAEVTQIQKMVEAINKDGIYILPEIPLKDLEDANRENDDKKFRQLLENVVQPVISDIFLKLKNGDNTDRTVDNMIYLVKQSESDTKFVQWLEIHYQNFVHGITYDEIKNYYYKNIDENGKGYDLSETPVATGEQLFEDYNKALENERKLGKKRIRRIEDERNNNRNDDNAGFGRTVDIILILTLLMGAAFIIWNMLLK